MLEHHDPLRRAHARWPGVLMAMALLPGCAPEDEAEAAAVSGVPTYEEFRASLPRFEESWTVEGDIAIHSEEELRAYYQGYVAGPAEGLGTSEQALVIGLGGTNVNGNNIVPPWLRNYMTYCVSNGFGSHKATVVAEMNEAVAAWEQILDVDFVHDATQDAVCDRYNDNVWFNVRRTQGSTFQARAFFPDYGRTQRELLIDNDMLVSPNALSNNVLQHELGHILGFRHEYNHDDYGKPTCKEGPSNDQPVPYDPASVMHYTVNQGGGCTGSATKYGITRLDTMAAQSYYGPPANKCSQVDTDTCWARDAWCDPAYNYNASKRSDLCRWSEVYTQAECEAPERRGGWTTASSAFSQVWPTAVPDFADAACVTQVANLRCSVADENLCLLHGASCERAFDRNGKREDLCRWYGSHDAASCPAPGFWTTLASPFGQAWPTAVGLWPVSQDAACITQVRNLK